MAVLDWWIQVRQYREETAGLNQLDFAEMLNDCGLGLKLTQRSISHIESGQKKKLDLSFARAFLQVSGINLLDTEKITKEIVDWKKLAQELTQQNKELLQLVKELRAEIKALKSGR
jgi:transcriptional regulator with XRE-family HTH domain